MLKTTKYYCITGAYLEGRHIGSSAEFVPLVERGGILCVGALFGMAYRAKGICLIVAARTLVCPKTKRVFGFWTCNGKGGAVALVL